MYMLVHGQGDVHIPYKYIIVCVFMLYLSWLKNIMTQVLTLKSYDIFCMHKSFGS